MEVKALGTHVIGPVPRSAAPGGNPAEWEGLAILEGVRVVGPNALLASCPVPGHGAGRGDRHPSLSIRRVGVDGRLRVHCFAGCSRVDVLAALDLAQASLYRAPPRGPRAYTARPAGAFTEKDASGLWDSCLEALREGRDHKVREYLALRRIPDRGGETLFGQALARWFPYLLSVPLYDITTADLVNVQMRRIDQSGEPKILVPRGSRVSGTAFMNFRARGIVRGDQDPAPCVFGEGLTDFLALARAADLPVISAVGVGNAPGAVGTWVKGRKVLLALDTDKAGESAAGKAAQRVLRRGGHPLRVRWPAGAKDACDLVARWGFERFGAEFGKAIEEHLR